MDPIFVIKPRHWGLCRQPYIFQGRSRTRTLQKKARRVVGRRAYMTPGYLNNALTDPKEVASTPTKLALGIMMEA